MRSPAAPGGPHAGACVLVLQSHLRPGPWVVRSLERAGFRVIGASDHALTGARLARRAAHADVPAPGAGATAFVAAVRRAVERFGVDVILPLSESALAAIAERGGDDLVGRLAGPTREQYRLLADKERLGGLAVRLGVGLMPGVIVGVDGMPAAPLPGPPVVVKPLASASASAGGVVYQRPVFAATAGERDRAIATIAAVADRVLVQPYLEGPRWHVHAWRTDAASGGIASMVRRSWPPRTGMTSASEVVDHPAAVEAVIALLREIGYRGVASADLIALPGGGFAIHDVNPRLPFSVAEAVGAGLDTPRLAVEIALGAREPYTAPPAPDGTRYHWVSGEARWLGRRGGGGVARELLAALGDRDGTVDPLTRGVALPGLLDLAGTGLRRLRGRFRHRAGGA
jgi:D-aspartate ligase